jgi:phage tail-like protein
MSDPGFRYLNLENRWPLINMTARPGLVIRDDGALSLARTAAVTNPPPTAQALAAALAGPANLGVDTAGSLYLVDPAGARVLRWDVCAHPGEANETVLLPWFGSPGSLPGQLRQPQGLIVGPRQALYVADTGNHRIQVVDLATRQVRALWGQLDPYAEPQPSDAAGRFAAPVALAVDAAGAIYVAEAGNQRVQKLDADGRADLAFTLTGVDAAAVAVALIDGQERLLVIERDGSLHFYALNDASLDEVAAQRWQALADGQPVGILFSGETLYVALEAGSSCGRLLTFDGQGRFLGVVADYTGPLAGLSLDFHGRLWIDPGAGRVRDDLLPGQAFVENGAFLAGPLIVSDRPVAWQRLTLDLDPLAAGCHVRLWTFSGDPATLPPPPPTGWEAAPLDADDLWVPSQPAPALWLYGELQGDHDASPVLHQVRVSFDAEGWLRYLPAIYQQDAGSRDFLTRLLALFESLLADTGQPIDTLPRLIDPWAAPDAPQAPWLAWLAGWLALDLDDTWDEARRRLIVAEAFELYSWRGTAAGLRRLVSLAVGAPAYVHEGALLAGAWRLQGAAALGAGTQLPPLHPQGATLDTSAALGQTLLVGEQGGAVPLFGTRVLDVTVQLYAWELPDPTIVGRLQALLERESPAHLRCQLCLIEPALRVGQQATLGVDTILAGPPPALTLAQGQPLGVDTILPDARRGQPGAVIGQDARLDRPLGLA